VIINNVARANKIELSEADFNKSQEIIVTALQGGKHLTRVELCRILLEKGVPAAQLGGLLIVQRAHADGLICYAAREGKRQLLTLIDDWLPDAKDLPADEALARLTWRYFNGHGPATLEDFAFANVIVIDGEIAGAWKKVSKTKSAEISVNLFMSLDQDRRQQLDATIALYSSFMNLPGRPAIRVQEKGLG
jgi:hypothetical protein